MNHFRLIAKVAILFLAVAFSLANAANVRSFSVDALSWRELTFNLGNGQRFSGSLSIGGGGNDIEFWVKDPTGATILNWGRVYSGRSFEFTANKDGAYTLHFDNSFSWFSSRTVHLTYDIHAPLIFGFEPLVFAAIVTLILLGAVAAIAPKLRRKHGPKIQQ